MRFADPPVVAGPLKAFEGGFIPSRGAVELLLNEGRTAQDEEGEAGVRKRRRHIVAELAQASIALREQLFGLTILALSVRQKSRDRQGLTNQQRVTQLACQRHALGD